MLVYSYKTNSMQVNVSEKLIVLQLVKTFPVFVEHDGLLWVHKGPPMDFILS
jgi:hypothetical protein